MSGTHSGTWPGRKPRTVSEQRSHRSRRTLRLRWTRGGSFRGTRRRFGNALRRTRFLQPRRPNPHCESHTRAVPLPGGCEHRTQTPRWRGEGGRGERLGMRKLIAALFVTLDGYGFGEAAAPLVLLAGGTTMLSWPDALDSSLLADVCSSCALRPPSAEPG